MDPKKSTVITDFFYKIMIFNLVLSKIVRDKALPKEKVLILEFLNRIKTKKGHQLKFQDSFFAAKVKIFRLYLIFDINFIFEHQNTLFKKSFRLVRTFCSF